MAKTMGTYQYWIRLGDSIMRFVRFRERQRRRRPWVTGSSSSFPACQAAVVEASA
jgi:hypothetical protein